MTISQSRRCKEEILKIREFLRMQGKPLTTERSYVPAVKKYLHFLCEEIWHDGVASKEKVEKFLTNEAKRGVSSSTQNTFFYAICYYYRHIRKEPLQDVDALRSNVGERVRQAPCREDVRKILMAIQDSGPYPTRLIVHLLYGCGLRITETLSIRIKDVDVDAGRLTIVGGKGKKDRFINLPPCLLPQLRIQIAAAEAVWKKAVAMGVPVKLPHLYHVKNPAARFQRRWFWLFPMNQPCVDPRGEGRVWWRILDDTVQRAMRSANRRAGTEGITPHHLRHAWATHVHHDGACLRDIQEILGHRDPKTTARYLTPDAECVPSPLEKLGIAI